MVRRVRATGGPALTAWAMALLVLLSSSARAAEVTASVDRNRIVEGETITLVLQTDDTQQSLDTDLGVLEPDFAFLGQQSATQMSIVNGRQEAVVRLLITLEPTRAGTLTIPALQFPGARTDPITINVEPAPELKAGEPEPVFIELSLDPADGPYYVLAQLSLTVRIFYQQNLTEAAITPPAPGQASVRLLDEIPFQADRNGERYRVLERRYAIFPERSGMLEIPPLELTGRLIERPSNRLWQPSVRGRRVRIQSERLAIPVEPRPANFTGEHWLPARRVTITQQLSDADSLRVGEPVTRSVIVDAVGLEENMIEEPGWPELADARIYPDQPQGITRDDGQWVLGHKEFRYAVVPEQPGELVLPELRLDWWDTVANEPRSAVVPEHRIMVAARDLVPDTALMPPGAEDALAGEELVSGAVARSADFWRLSALSLALLWLFTLFLYLRKPGSPAPHREAERELPEDEAELIRAIKAACQHGEAADARKALSRWVRLFGPEQAHGSLMEFAAGLDASPLRDAIYRFDAAGFSAAPDSDLDGRELWRAFEEWRRSGPARAPERQATVPDLYRQAR